MRCPDCARCLSALLADALETPLRLEAEAHLSRCDDCLQRLTALIAEAADFAAPDAAALTRRILQATAPDPCAASEALLCDYGDGTLDAERAHYLRLHLNGCAHCRQMQAALAGMEAELGLLATHEPPAELLDDILRQTLGVPRPARARPSSLPAFGWRLLRRPRFPLEAAFAATLCWIVLFGIPAPVVPTAFAEPAALAEAVPLQQIMARAQGSLREIIVPVPALEGRFDALNDYSSRLLQQGVQAAQHSGDSLWQWLSRELDTVVSPLTAPATH